ncbi:hypothetical protein [Pedobacter sp.]
MKIEYLLDLFESGQYVQCLAHINDFLNHPVNNTELTLLRAKCLFEISDTKYNRFEEAYSNFIEVLEINPTQYEALHYGIHIAVFIIKDHADKVIELCDGWLQWATPTQQIEALNYRAKAYLMLKNFSAALNDYDKLISTVKLVHAADRSQLDSALSIVYLKKAHIALNEMNEPELALNFFKRGFDYHHNDALKYAEISKLAFLHKAYDFGGAAAIQFFSANQNVPVKEVSELYAQIKSLIESGIVNKNLVHAKLVASKVFGSMVEQNPLDNLNFIRELLKVYPDWDVLYHYYGAELHNAEGYDEALPYIQKSMSLGGSAFDVCWYLESTYRARKQMHTLQELPTDDAKNYYYAALIFQNTELKLKNPHNAAWFLENRAMLYAQSFNVFCSYFFKQLGSSKNNDKPLFATCCNNYGLALAELKNYEEAERVHRIGYSFHPFWKQLNNWSKVLMHLRRYSEAISKVQQVLKEEKGKLTFDDYLELRYREALAFFNLGNKEQAEIILTILDQEYDQRCASGKTTNKGQQQALKEQYVQLQHLRAHLLQNKSIEHAIEIWQKQLQRNPDDHFTWLMLMQGYFELNNDKQCIACANNYLALTGGALLSENAQQVYYRRGIALANTDQYERAISDLNFVFELHYKHRSLSDLEFVTLCSKLAHCHQQLKNWRSCLGFVQVAMDIFSISCWSFDTIYLEVILRYADANYALGNIRKAKKALAKIQLYQPENSEVLKRQLTWNKSGFFSFLKISN